MDEMVSMKDLEKVTKAQGSRLMAWGMRGAPHVPQVI